MFCNPSLPSSVKLELELPKGVSLEKAVGILRAQEMSGDAGEEVREGGVCYQFVSSDEKNRSITIRCHKEDRDYLAKALPDYIIAKAELQQGQNL